MVHILLAAIVVIAFIGRDKDRTITRIAFVLLFLFAALRYMFGNDYNAYMEKFQQIQNGRLDVFDWEYLYTLLNLVTPSFYILVALTSLIFVYGIYRLISRELPKNYVWLGLLIFVINPYLFMVNLSAMRQCLSMVLVISAVSYASQRKVVPYLLLMVAASLFHMSAIFLLPAYFIMDTKPVKSGAIVIILLVLFLGLYIVDVQSVLLSVARFLGNSNYLYYASTDLQNSLRATLLTAIYFIFVLTNLPKLKGRMLVYGKLYLVGTMLGVLAFRASMLTRIQMYFDIFSVVVIPAIMVELRKEGIVKVDPKHPIASMWACVNHYALPILIFAVFILRYYSFFTNPMWEPFFEYHTIFELIN